MKKMDRKFLLKSFLFKYIVVVIIGILCMGILNLSIDRKKKVSSIKSSEICQRKLYELQKGGKGTKKDTKLKNKLEGTDEKENNKNSCNILSNEDLLSRINQKYLKKILNKEDPLKVASSDKEKIKDKVINYNDLTKHLNRKEVLAVLETINENTPKNDLINIWSHVVGINREEMDKIIDKIISYTEHYINNYNENNISMNEIKTYLNMNSKGWNDFKIQCVKKIACDDFVFSQSFYKILKKEKKIEEIKKLIESYIKYADDIKKKEYESYINWFHCFIDQYVTYIRK
ncbi:Plasmodium exported protein (PHISTa), unknown function [Plasmodium sp. gorilla clade G2]|uniref:Plasmodium exported protein (PHISTa), unknown function n=1 Tax=Plasmodium sp. gorilla clade G2 TaxID=880535 RepID=UPI000D20A1AE|nr:Plasmodium exported protein (PHISTa), unknown function [Plasmodium sp. gorilla clade G2]SOV16391.1 Plasmodium exported protein (PHISTa), unknown function [Plasmodium sp. gorilla clade G2]